MAETRTESKTVTFSHKRLSITREAELLQSYVRLTEDQDGDGDAAKSEQQKDEQKKEKQQQQQQEESEKEGGGGGGGEAKTTDEAQQTPSEEVKKKLKKKRRRNVNRREELYCDKDRAAAVNMGSKDIKQSLKLKRKQDRSKALSIPEEAEPSNFLALGTYQMGKGDLQIALEFISKALELNPAEKGALVSRSKCYILLGQPENALKDAETALNIDKTFLKAIYQKAEALYYLGDFEHSLMYYHRGLHIRPDHEDFTLGVRKAQKAIENAIGADFSFTRLMAAGASASKSSAASSSRKNRTSDSGITSLSATPKPDSTAAQSGGRLVSSSRKSASSGRKSSRLLRELQPDKEYLDNLMKNPNIKCKFKEDDTEIARCIEEAVDYLNARQEFWRQQLPYHLK